MSNRLAGLSDLELEMEHVKYDGLERRFRLSGNHLGAKQARRTIANCEKEMARRKARRKAT